MNEREFEIGEKKFKLNKIDPFKQFHVVRRLGPILGDLIPLAQKIKKMQVEGEKSEDQMFDEIALVATPVLSGLSKLSDEDSNLVLLSLCSAVEIHQPKSNSWARVSTEKTLMFQDLELPELLRIACKSFMYNLSGFFRSAPQSSPSLR